MRRFVCVVLWATFLSIAPSFVDASRLNRPENFGADPNDFRDDTAAVQAAIHAGSPVYMSPGYYTVCGLVAEYNNGLIAGAGTGSVWQQTTSCGAPTFDTAGYSLTMRDMVIDGSDNSSKKTTENPGTNWTGLRVGSQADVVLDRVTVQNFPRYGLVTYDGSTNRSTHLKVSNSTFKNSWDCFVVSQNYGEYIQVTNSDISGCRYGLDIESGNFIASNMKITDNGIGVYVYGQGISNNGHGSISNSMINHSAVASIQCSSVSIGFNFVGNQIHDGPIFLYYSTGINITNGTIDIQDYWLEGGGKNLVAGNFFYGAYDNTVHHNVNGHTDQTTFTGNFSG